MTKMIFQCLMAFFLVAASAFLSGCTSSPPVPLPVPTTTPHPVVSVTQTTTELTNEEYLRTHPPPPQNVRGAFQTDHVSLRWEVPVKVSVPHDYSDIVAHYRIYKGTTEKDLSYFTSVSIPAFSDYNVSKSGRYLYQITAVMAGESESSPSANVIIEVTPVTNAGSEGGLTYEEYRRITPPSPENLTAVFRGTYIGLHWDAPVKETGPHDYSDTVAYYRIYKGTTENSLAYLTSVTGSAFNDGNISANTQYYYEVTAVMTGETESSAAGKIRVATA